MMLREFSDREPDPPREGVFGSRRTLIGALAMLAVLAAIVIGAAEWM